MLLNSLKPKQAWSRYRGNRLRIWVWLSLTAVLGSGCDDRKPGIDHQLQEQLQAKAARFHGDVGIYVRHLQTNRMAAVRPDSLFPTASMIKVPIMLKIFDRIERGELSPDSSLIFRRDSINYPYQGGDAVARFAEGEDITVSQLIAHMLTFSDNYASLWLQKLAGGGAAINAWLAEQGFTTTRVNSRTPGREPDWERYGWGQTSPREMTELLIMIREARAVSPRASEDMYRFLTRSYWDGAALSQIPPTVQAASKQGAVNASRSEVVLVNAPHGDYAFCVITSHQTDTSWSVGNEGFVLLREISRLLWEHFEPGNQWQPAQGMEMFW